MGPQKLPKWLGVSQGRKQTRAVGDAVDFGALAAWGEVLTPTCKIVEHVHIIPRVQVCLCRQTSRSCMATYPKCETTFNAIPTNTSNANPFLQVVVPASQPLIHTPLPVWLVRSAHPKKSKRRGNGSKHRAPLWLCLVGQADFWW